MLSSCFLGDPESKKTYSKIGHEVRDVLLYHTTVYIRYYLTHFIFVDLTCDKDCVTIFLLS